MTAASHTLERIAAAAAAIGDRRLDESAVRAHLAPLFTRALARDRIYLANHSLGRPLDAMQDDLAEAATAWYANLGDAWDAWGDELAAFRARLARLIGAPSADHVIPKTSAGAGLRAVLNAADTRLRVTTTRGEFDSLDVILREYAHRGRIALDIVDARGRDFDEDDLHAAIDRGTDLVVVSQAMFRTGQLLTGLDAIVARAHAKGARVLADVYHSLGVVPVDVATLGVDYAVGGSYKYLRGGPGACFLYVAPAHLDGAPRTLDTGWFAKEAPFRYERPDPPRFAKGGDGWMESTPPIFTWYQARSGQAFTLAVGVERLRAYSLVQQRMLVEALRARGIEAIGATADRGAFVVVYRENAPALAEALGRRGIDVDARGDCLRLCPDVLTTPDEIERAAAALRAAAA
jgi:kynureninase